MTGGKFVVRKDKDGLFCVLIQDGLEQIAREHVFARSKDEGDADMVAYALNFIAGPVAEAQGFMDSWATYHKRLDIRSV